MNNQEVEEELLGVLQQTKEKKVVVEGKRDKIALCSLGFKDVVTIHKGIYETAEGLAGKGVIVLTDFDSEGREIAKKLNLILHHLGCKVDIETRRKIGHLFRKLKITKIEELRGVYNE